MASSFTNLYERKIFVIGLSNALNCESVAQVPALVEGMLEIVQQVVKMLNALKNSEFKALKKAGKKEIKDDDDDEDEDNESDDDDDDLEDDDDEDEDNDEDEDLDD